MNDPLADRFLPKFLLQQSVLVAEQLHGQFVVRRLEQSNQLIAKIVGKIRRFCDRWTKLFFRRSVQTYVIACSLITVLNEYTWSWTKVYELQTDG